jgi:oligopeptide/dipeptide ABC transporter ATP-binding protein
MTPEGIAQELPGAVAPAMLLDVRGLCVDIRTPGGALRVVRDVSLTVARGEAVGLVGESGSGKSMTAFSVMNLFPSPLAHVAAGEIHLEGQPLQLLSADAMRAVRGARMGMVFQDPSSYLDPLMPVGRQIAETLHAHRFGDDHQARVLELLELMELPQAAQVARKYPHELSGGMRQRILIACALAMRPALLIADEPTTALDVTVQSGILKLLSRLRRELDLGLLLITHDLAVVAETCQRVYVMYAGEIVEHQHALDMFEAPRHPYTQGLLRSILHPRSRALDLFSIPGGVPIAGHWPVGCRFHPRCPIAQPGRCDAGEPALVPVAARHGSGADRCHRAEEPQAADAWSHGRPAEAPA